MTRYTVTAEFTVELPDGQERLDLYGRHDPLDCITIDFENDPAMFLLEQTENFKFSRINLG